MSDLGTRSLSDADFEYASDPNVRDEMFAKKNKHKCLPLVIRNYMQKKVLLWGWQKACHIVHDLRSNTWSEKCEASSIKQKENCIPLQINIKVINIAFSSKHHEGTHSPKLYALVVNTWGRGDFDLEGYRNESINQSIQRFVHSTTKLKPERQL